MHGEVIFIAEGGNKNDIIIMRNKNDIIKHIEYWLVVYNVNLDSGLSLRLIWC